MLVVGLLLAQATTASAAGPTDPAAWVRLDPGPLAATVFEGFSRLDPTGSDDPRVRWTTPPTGARATNVPDPLADDGLVGGVVHVDLPPGRWQVAAMLGDPVIAWEPWATARSGLKVDGRDAIVVELPSAFADFLASEAFSPNPRPVFRPTETAFDRVAAPKSRWRRVTVDVGPGGLDLAPFATPLRGLVLAPDGVDLDGELALIDARRGRWWSTYVHPTPDRLPPLVPGPLTATLAPVSSRSPDDVDPAPLQLARGDRAARLVWLGGDDGPGTVRVVDADGLDVRVAEVSWLDDTAQMADPLEPAPTVVWSADGSFRGGQGVPPALALDVHTPADARPGKRTVRLEITRGDEVVRVDVDVVVHPIALGDRPHGGLFAEVPPAARLRLGLQHPATLALLDAQIDLLADLGFDAMSLRNAADIFGDPTDTRVLEHAAARWKEHGGVALVWMDVLAYLRAKGDAATDDVLGRMLAKAAATAIPTWVVLFEEDDWRQEGAVALGRARLQRARRLHPTALRLAGPSTPAGWPVIEEAEVALVGGERDVLVDAIARARGWGATAWAYNLAPGASGPLQAWAVGAEGLLEWHADALPHDPFDLVLPWDRRSHLLLGPDGVLHPTTRLLDLADGLADARLLATLEDRLDRLPPARRVDAERLLEATRAVLRQASVIPGAHGVALPPADRARVRARALALLAHAPT